MTLQPRTIKKPNGGFQIHHDLMNSYEALCLTNREFVDAFYAAVNGEGGPLSKWVRPWNCRPDWSDWAAIRTRIFARDDYTCQYCGERGKKLECDHFLPVSKGGDHSDENLKTACFPCNRSKRAKTFEEWKGVPFVAQA